MKVVAIPDELWEELSDFAEAEGRAKSEVAALAIRRFLARPSFGKEVFKIKPITKAAWDIIYNHVSMQELRDWAYQNNMTIDELNAMIVQQSLFTGLEPFKVV